VVRVGSDC
jgi:hypothetical protein